METGTGLYRLDGVAPHLADPASTYVAPGAALIGRIVLGARVSVWFGAVLRGDNEPITIGEGCNIQEHAVMHTDPGFPLTMGQGCTIGHRAMLHGCTIGSNSLIGIGAIVLNGARIGADSLVGAGALVTEGKSFPDGSLIIGSPARVARPLTEAQIEGLRRSAAHYVENGRRFKAGLTAIQPILSGAPSD